MNPFPDVDEFFALPVSQRHIDNGKLLEPCDCPVALALMDRFSMPEHTVSVSVERGDVLVCIEKSNYELVYEMEADLSPSSREFIGMFDSLEPVKPSVLVLKVTEIRDWTKDES